VNNYAAKHYVCKHNVWLHNLKPLADLITQLSLVDNICYTLTMKHEDYTLLLEDFWKKVDVVMKKEGVI
jgi:hypothetical protein